MGERALSGSRVQGRRAWTLPGACSGARSRPASPQGPCRAAGPYHEANNRNTRRGRRYGRRDSRGESDCWPSRYAAHPAICLFLRTAAGRRSSRCHDGANARRRGRYPLVASGFHGRRRSVSVIDLAVSQTSAMNTPDREADREWDCPAVDQLGWHLSADTRCGGRFVEDGCAVVDASVRLTRPRVEAWAGNVLRAQRPEVPVCRRLRRHAEQGDGRDYATENDDGDRPPPMGACGTSCFDYC